MSAPTRPDVTDVLRAVGKASLLAILPEEEARLLAGPVARAEARVPFDRDAEVAAARLLQSVRDTLGPPLAHLGVEIPPPPPAVSPRPSASADADVRLVLRALAGGFIGLYGAPYALRELILTIPGHEQHPARDGQGRRCWRFPATPAGAATLMERLAPFAPTASPGVLALVERHAAAMAARAVLADDAPVPEDDGTDYVNMPLWTHQRRFMAFGQESEALLFAVKMGGGKTGATIALANKIQAGRVLIVAPNRVRRVWLREVRERSSVAWHIVDGTRPKKVGKGRIDLSQPERVAECTATLFDCDCGAPVHAYAVNYEALGLAIWQRWTPVEKLDLVIYDEAHRLKNHLQKHKRKVKGLTKQELAARNAKDLPKWTISGIAGEWRANTRRVIGLSGTPMPQHPWDIFGIYRALDPGIFGTVWTTFRDEYLELDKTGTFPKRIRPDKLDEFAAKVMSIMYRPTVDLDLPGCRDVLRTVTLERDARRVYDEMDAELWTDLTSLLARQRARRLGLPEPEPEDTAGVPAELTIKNILGRLLRLRQLTGGTLPTDDVAGPNGEPVPGPRVQVSTAKAEALADILEEIGCVKGREDATGARIDPEPVVVFCQFTEDLAAVARVADEAGLRYGEISGRRGDGLNDDARMSADCDVVGVQIQAGGTGVDLTRACYGVWYSIGYSVSDYDQARARMYRPGQLRPVLYIHIQAEDTWDEKVYEAISDRRDAVGAVLRAGGIEPEEIGVIERDPGPDPLTAVTTHSDQAAVVLPWE